MASKGLGREGPPVLQATDAVLLKVQGCPLYSCVAKGVPNPVRILYLLLLFLTQFRLRPATFAHYLLDRMSIKIPDG